MKKDHKKKGSFIKMRYELYACMRVCWMTTVNAKQREKKKKEK
jgi:hypothetical protein